MQKLYERYGDLVRLIDRFIFSELFDQNVWLCRVAPSECRPWVGIDQTGLVFLIFVASKMDVIGRDYQGEDPSSC